MRRVAAVARGHAAVRRRRGALQRHGRRAGRGGRAPPSATARDATITDERLGQQQQERERERDLEAVLPAALERARELALFHGGDVIAVELGEAERRAARVHVGAAGVDGDLLERLLVEARLHDLPAAVLHESAAALTRDQLALRGAETDREELHAAVRRLLDRVVDVAL